MNAVVPVVNIWLRNYRTEIFYREKLKRLENIATVIKFSVVVVVVVVPDLVPACFCRETSSFGRENVAKSCFGKSASVSYCEISVRCRSDHHCRRSGRRRRCHGRHRLKAAAIKLEFQSTNPEIQERK